MKYSHKFVATYIQGTYGYSAYDFLTKNPLIREVHIINLSAGPNIRDLEAQKAALGIIHYFETLQIPREKNYNQKTLLANLTKKIKDGSEKVDALSNEVDNHYLFADEPTQVA